MVLNSRCIEIMKVLQLESQYLEELCKMFGMTSRSIRYDFDNINFILKNLKLNLIEKNNEKKFYLDLKKNDMEKIFRDFSELSQEERRDYLLFKITVKNKLNLSEEAKILDVTKNVLRTDLDKIVENSKLNIKSIQGKGIFLLDEEEKIREVLSDKLMFFIKKTDILKEPVRTLFIETSKKYNLLLVAQNIEKIKKIDSSLIDDDFHKILALLLSASIRESNVANERKEFLSEIMGIELRGVDIQVTDFERKEIFKIISKEEWKEDKNIYELLSNLKKDLDLKIDFPEELHKVLENIYVNNRKHEFLKIQKNLEEDDENYLLVKILTSVKKIFPELYRDYSFIMAMKIREFIFSQNWNRIKNREIVLVSSIEKTKLKQLTKEIKRVLNMEVSEIFSPFIFNLLPERNNSNLIFTTENMQIVESEKIDKIIHLEMDLIENYFTLKNEELEKIFGSVPNLV